MPGFSSFPTLLRHIIVLWGIKKLPFSYANRTALNGHIVAFSRDIVAGDTPPTISISPNWRELKDFPVPSPHMAAYEATKLKPDNHSISKAVVVSEKARIPIACIAPLALVHLLLTAPYLSPAAAYTLLSVRAAAYSWDAPLAPLMK